MKRYVAGLGMAVWAACAGGAEARRPNVLFILTDDQRWDALSLAGNRHLKTPNIDRMAAEGMRFTNFNVEAECTPSRSALMTGRYAVRSGTTRAVPLPGIPQGMAPWEYTMAEMFKDAGYDTAIFGKWHIGSVRADGAAAHALPQHEHHVLEVAALEDVEVLDVETAPVARRVLADLQRAELRIPQISHLLVVDLCRQRTRSGSARALGPARKDGPRRPWGAPRKEARMVYLACVLRSSTCSKM